MLFHAHITLLATVMTSPTECLKRQLKTSMFRLTAVSRALEILSLIKMIDVCLFLAELDFPGKKCQVEHVCV